MALVPNVPEVLAETAGLLVQCADPSMSDADRANRLGLSAGLLGLAAEVVDKAAHILFTENRAVRAVLGQGARTFPDAPFAERLRELSHGADEDLRVSALQAQNGVLRAALIELHTACEAAQGSAVRALETAIWEELVDSSERRKLAGSPV